MTAIQLFDLCAFILSLKTEELANLKVEKQEMGKVTGNFITFKGTYYLHSLTPNSLLLPLLCSLFNYKLLQADFLKSIYAK